MDSSQQLMFALQSPVGLRFGAALDVDSERITFEMDLKIPKGTECSFRMELSGEEDTIMGTVRVERLLPQRGAKLPRYVARILEMSMDDRDRFDGWRRDTSTGGVSRRLERDPEQLKTQISNKMMGGATEAESRAVLDRMNAKRTSRRKEEGYVEGDPLGLSAEEQVHHAPDKAEIRERLRVEQPQEVVDVAAKQKEEEAARQVASEALIDELAVPETAKPSWMPDQSIEQPAVVERVVEAARPAAVVTPPAAVTGSTPLPMVVVDANAHPIAITIIYLSHESFVQDYQKTLHTSAITVEHASLNQLYHPVRVRLQFAHGDVMDMMGQIVAPLPDGMAIALECDSDQREQLKQLAER